MDEPGSALKRLLTATVSLLIKTASCVFVVAAAIIAYQAIMWLKLGYWTGLPISRFFNPGIDWAALRGGEKIWDSLLDFPISAAVVALGFAIMFVALRLDAFSSSRFPSVRVRR